MIYKIYYAMANILLLCVRLFELSLWERRYQIQPTDSRRQACDPEQTVLHPELTPGLSGWHANSHITWKNLIFPSIFLQLLLRLILLLLLLCVERFHFLKNLKNASIQLFLLLLSLSDVHRHKWLGGRGFTNLTESALIWTTVGSGGRDLTNSAWDQLNKDRYHKQR